jgi:hypothetical protein
MTGQFVTDAILQEMTVDDPRVDELVIRGSDPPMTVWGLLHRQNEVIARRNRELAERDQHILDYERLVTSLNEKIAALSAEQRDSLGVLLLLANDPTVPVHLRIKAAEGAADRQYPRLSANISQVDVRRTDWAEQTREARLKQMARQKAERGITVIDGGGPEAA